jgi:rRNA-processing protein FCF1
MVPSMRQPLRLHLKIGVQPEQTVEALTGRILAARNLPGSASRGGTTPAADAAYLDRRQADYLQWVEATEGQLGNVTHDPDVLALPFTPAYYEIRQLIPTSPRAVAFIDSEIARQARNLEGLRDDLQRRLERARAAPGALAVLDTNVLLHHQLPDGVAWREVVGQESVRVVIPLRVIEELDEKKYSASDKLRSRARQRLPRLYALVEAGGAPKALPNGHGTLEVFIEPGPRARPADADTEILETAHELAQLSGSKATIVTGDTGMRLRAEAEGLATVTMPASAE